MTTSVERGINELRKGALVIVFDDLNRNSASLIGAAESVTPQNVNAMTKVGKGLVCVCLSESKAKAMHLPLMVDDIDLSVSKPYAISVDCMSTTTGISSFERSDTIKAFTNKDLNVQQFRTPGHVFPLIAKDDGLLRRVDIVEAAVDLASWSSTVPVAYSCEVLNTSGEMASKEEVEILAKSMGMILLLLSELLNFRRHDLLSSFACFIGESHSYNSKMGYPSSKLHIDPIKAGLDKGVYGVYVLINHMKYVGVMNVGLSCEVHLLGFHQKLQDQVAEVEVKCLIRTERAFHTLEDFIVQFGNDVKSVEQRFGFHESKDDQEVFYADYAAYQ